MKLVYTRDLKSLSRKGVRVRFPPAALTRFIMIASKYHNLKIDAQSASIFIYIPFSIFFAKIFKGMVQVGAVPHKTAYAPNRQRNREVRAFRYR